MSTKIIFLKKPKLSNPILFIGLPGIGLVGKIAVDYLLKQFKAEKIAEIISDSFPPSIHTHDSIVELIKDEIYYYKFNGKDLLFLTGPVQPSLDAKFSSSSEHYEFAETIAKTAKELGIKQIITLAGINVGDKRMVSEPEVIIASTNKKGLDEWQKIGAKSNTGDGLISGIAGLAVGIAKSHSIDGICLMGETNARLIYGDQGAAKKVLELLVKKFGFKVKMDRIEKEAEQIEEAFKQLSQQLDELKEDTDSNEKLTYVR